MTERALSDPAALRAFAHPLRQRILDLLAERPRAVPELAEALGTTRHRLYHHVRVLSRAGLVEPASTRVVSGITETSYRTTANFFRVDPHLLGSREVIDHVFGAPARNLVEAQRLRLTEKHPLIARAGTVWMTDAEAARLRSALASLLQEALDRPRGPQSAPYLVSVSAVPEA